MQIWQLLITENMLKLIVINQPSSSVSKYILSEYGPSPMVCAATLHS